MDMHHFRIWLDGFCVGIEDMPTQDQIYRIHAELEKVSCWPDEDAGRTSCECRHCPHCGAPE